MHNRESKEGIRKENLKEIIEESGVTAVNSGRRGGRACELCVFFWSRFWG